MDYSLLPASTVKLQSSSRIKQRSFVLKIKVNARGIAHPHVKADTDLQRVSQSIHNASSISHGWLVLEIPKHQPSANLRLTVRERESSSNETIAAASSDLLPVASAHGKVKVVTHYTWPEAFHRDQE